MHFNADVKQEGLMTHFQIKSFDKDRRDNFASRRIGWAERF